MKTLKYFALAIIIAGISFVDISAQDLLPVPPAIVEMPEEPEFKLLFTKEKEEEYLKNIDEDLKKDLLELKKENKGKYFNLLMRSELSRIEYPHLTSEQKKLRERTQKISVLEINTQVIVFKYKKATDAEKVKIKKDLEEKLRTLFGLREDNRRFQIDRLENEIKELRETIRMRKRNKNLIINKRMQELLGEDKYLEWD